MTKIGVNFDFDKLNRPANSEEALEKRVSPCAGHDTQEEESIMYDRLNLIKSRVFDSGARRDSNSDKPFIHNLLGYTRRRFGYHMNLGSRKYGDGNWLKGMPTQQYLESLDRHLAAYIDGDRSEDHLSAIIFNVQGVMLNEKNEGIAADYHFNKLNNAE